MVILVILCLFMRNNDICDIYHSLTLKSLLLYLQKNKYESYTPKGPKKPSLVVFFSMKYVITSPATGKSISCLPDSRKAVVSFWQKNVHNTG